MRNTNFDNEIEYMVDYKNNTNKFMNAHSWKIIVGLVLLAIIGGLQALNGVAGFSAYITSIVPVLLAIEHLVSGNTGN